MAHSLHAHADVSIDAALAASRDVAAGCQHSGSFAAEDEGGFTARHAYTSAHSLSSAAYTGEPPPPKRREVLRHGTRRRRPLTHRLGGLPHCCHTHRQVRRPLPEPFPHASTQPSPHCCWPLASGSGLTRVAQVVRWLML